MNVQTLHRRSWSAVARLFAISGAVAMLALAAGCGDDDPVAPAGFEAKGLALRIGTADTVVDSSSVKGMIEVQEGGTTADISLLFIAKSDGKRTVPTGSEYTLSWSVANSNVASIESVSAWSFRVKGKQAGSTTATFSLSKNNSVVYTSSPVTIRVNAVAVAAGWQVGDTLIYDYYDRDTMNKKQAQFKKTRLWTVLRADISLDGRDKVSEILEVTYDTTMQNEFDRDTLYLTIASDGSIYQYDLLRKLLERVEGGNAFSSNLQPLWVRVSSPNTAGAAAWSSIGVDSLYVPNITAPGIPTSLNAIFWMNASHKGTQSVTVPAGIFPNAVRTDHMLRLNVKIAGSIPLTILNDSIPTRIEASAREGILYHSFDSKKLVASVPGVLTQILPVTGFDMELKAVKRK